MMKALSCELRRVIVSELKNCPFCGGKAHIDTEYDMDGFGNFHKVECLDCGASSKQHFCTQGNECPEYYNEVREDWQNRADNDKVAQLQAEKAELMALINKSLETAEFYKNCSGNKSTLQFGYSRVIEELSKNKLQ